MHPGERPTVWKKKPDNGLAHLNQDPEELTYVNDLTASLLRSSSLWGCPHPFSLGVHLCIASVSTKQTVSLCALPLVVLSLIINFALTFTVSASGINIFSTGGKDPGKNSF